MQYVLLFLVLAVNSASVLNLMEIYVFTLVSCFFNALLLCAMIVANWKNKQASTSKFITVLVTRHYAPVYVYLLRFQ